MQKERAGRVLECCLTEDAFGSLRCLCEDQWLRAYA